MFQLQSAYRRRRLAAAATSIFILAAAAQADAQSGAFFQGLGDLPGGGFRSVPEGISDDGSTVVGYSKSSLGEEAFRWTLSEGMVGLGMFSGGTSDISRAVDVSGDGSIIVGMSWSALGVEAFR